MRYQRKFRVFIGVVIIFAIFIFLPREREYDNKKKIELMERSIYSKMNQDECHHPNLAIDNPEIMKFYKRVERIDCGDPLKDWVSCEKSICFIKPEVISMRGDIICSYTDLLRENDYGVKYGKTLWTKEPYVLKNSDFLKVNCTAADGDRWLGLAYGIRDIVQRSVPELPASKLSSDYYPLYNILIFGFDSLSHNAFIRVLPKTYDYLTNNLHGIILNGYNIVGDGTPQALVPILTGFTELELPDTRKRVRNSVSVNSYPFIWDQYAKQGYITSFNEDIPKTGTFSYRMNGFDTQPVDHYLRTYYVEVDNILGTSKNFCISHQPAHQVMLDYTRNFMAKYIDNPKFIFSFHGELSHDSINAVGAIDNDVVKWLQQLKSKGFLNNTIFIFMSDHGNRFSEVRNTLQGKQEERLPFFGFVFPESFKKRFPQQYNNFVDNKDRLTTPFDVHATLDDILKLQVSDLKLTSGVSNFYDDMLYKFHPNQNRSKFKTNAPNRAISLFQQIPKNRSCADAYIEPHWCACLNWKQLLLNESSTFITVQKMAYSIIKAINEYTSPYRHLCEKFDLDEVNWALRLKPRDDLVRFKTNKDSDGYIADLSGNMKTHEEFYQLQIRVTPGYGLFEASVQYDRESFSINTRLSQISRINKYGSQANCIYNQYPELRKYCFCRL